MKPERLKRLIRLREHSEQSARLARAEAQRAVEKLERERDALIAQRRREENHVSSSNRANADDLRRQHAHLLLLELSLSKLAERVREAEARLAEEDDTWREARRSVKSLETLLARDAAKAAAAEELRQQKLLEAHAARLHARRGAEES